MQERAEPAEAVPHDRHRHSMAAAHGHFLLHHFSPRRRQQPFYGNHWGTESFCAVFSRSDSLSDLCEEPENGFAPVARHSNHYFNSTKFEPSTNDLKKLL